jgi:non-specific serine/threonine protein kinase/serine/threonine-protein kinase
MANDADRETIDLGDPRRAGDPGALPPALRADARPNMPERIGRFHLKRLIAAGGMGAVYEAVQDQPRRIVAVKVMRQGMTSRSALRRFEYESQILARLRHPGIGQIYEAGTHVDATTGASVPYFVMEYIPNARTITEFAQEKHLGSRERLDLFLQVCEAVHHGHQKGIIHRDLKPGNILIDASAPGFTPGYSPGYSPGHASSSGTGGGASLGHAKIIDFGVARATDSDLAVTTLQTDVGQLLGTIQYMSPEQIDADPHDIDIRSDVYALGVLLFELLVERLPYDVATVAVYEAARIIREQPPTRLSTVNRALRGDLETITLKALEKDRERRYQSAAELAQDIRRYLNGEPIAARPPGLAYQLRWFARRHRTAFAAATCTVLALVVGIIGTSWGMVQANEQRALAFDAQDAAEREADNARTISGFLKNMLTSVDPAIAQGREVTVRDLLDDLVARLDDEFTASPETEAEIRSTIGMTYRNLGRFREAEPHLIRALELRRSALGDEDRATLESMTQIGIILDDQGRRAEAEAQFRDALARQRRILGERDPLVLSTTNALAWTVSNLGRPAEAESLFRESLVIRRAIDGSMAPATIKTITNLAVTLIEQSRLDEAEPLIREAVASSVEALGDMHPDTLYTQSIMAWLYREQRRYDESVALYRSIVERGDIVLGPTHKHTLFWHNALAWALFDGGDAAAAETIARSVLNNRLRELGAEHPETIDSMIALGQMLLAQDRPGDAESELRRALAVTERALPAADFRRESILRALTRALIGQRRFAEAEATARDCLQLMTDQRSADDPAMRTVYELLADLYDAWGRAEQAATWRGRIDGQSRP